MRIESEIAHLTTLDNVALCLPDEEDFTVAVQDLPEVIAQALEIRKMYGRVMDEDEHLANRRAFGMNMYQIDHLERIEKQLARS